MNKNIHFVIDVESIGLHGEPYAVGYVAIDESGNELLAKRLSIFPHQAHGDEDDREWVEQNIPPIPLSHESMEDMLDEFWRDWIAWKEQGALMFAECGWPVEAKFLAMCAGRNWPTNKWQGPYPLHDIASIMLAAGMDPMATYERTESELPKHDPLADARQSARLLSMALAAAQPTASPPRPIRQPMR